MNQFQGQQFMNRAGVIAVPFEMAAHNLFHAFAFQVRTGQCSRIEQHLANVIRQRIPIPNSKVVKLVSTEKKALQVEG